MESDRCQESLMIYFHFNVYFIVTFCISVIIIIQKKRNVELKYLPMLKHKFIRCILPI